MWAAVALRGISKKMKVAAAQRVVVSLRGSSSAASWVIILTVHFAPAWPPPARTCQPTCPKNGGIRGVQTHGKMTLGGAERGRVH